MKKIFLLIVVLMFTIALGACSGFEEAYPETNTDGTPTFTLDDVKELIAESESGLYEYVAYQDEYIYELEELISLQWDILFWLNNESIIRDEITGDYEILESQYEELSDVMAIYLLETYPEFFDESILEDDPPEVFTYTYEDFTIEVEYISTDFIIVIEEVEVCGEICEVLEFNQTDFVITIEELEAYWKIYLETLHN